MKVWKIRYVDGVVHTVAAQTSLDRDPDQQTIARNGGAAPELRIRMP